MLRALVSTARRFLVDWNHSFKGDGLPSVELLGPPSPRSYNRLERLVITDQVCRTLFEEYAEHRTGARGDEEIGWVILGRREETEAVALATLPAGTQRSAGVAHIRFNSNAQAIASRIVRQWDKRLVLLGVFHTHPGSLRHPSDSDYQGDSQWVGQLRGGDGVFGIGTADVENNPDFSILQKPEIHRQIMGDMCFTWYALCKNDERYRKLPVEMTLGPDLARPLHPLWHILERHAGPLDRLCRQQASVVFEANEKDLTLRLPLAAPKSYLRIVLDGEEARFLVEEDGAVRAVDPEEEPVDRAVYLILAELAREAARSVK
ncbi:MAG: Mov34/MPN/PAD-1 family protein [Planctomycetes bacterium]|nr:Mov34/MPN/PAD-1 family protein [Planctomycetota bacterium]